MNNTIVCKVGELKALFEAKGEFKAKVGKDVVEKDKKNNKKAVADIEKTVKEYNPDAEKKGNFNYECFMIGNKDPMDAHPDKEITPEEKERIEALYKGYSSTLEQKSDNVKDPSLGYKGNETMYKEKKKGSEDLNDEEAKIKHAGLKSREMGTVSDFKPNTLFEGKKMKSLYFKKTVFLNESDMLKHIPEEYKVIGNSFGVKDAAGNEFIVECSGDSEFGFVKTDVVSTFNNEKINEQLERMRNLGGYNANHYSKTSDKSKSMVAEDLNIMRSLAKK